MAIKDLWEFSKGQTQRGIRGLSKGDLRAWGLLLTPFLLWAVLEVPRWQASRVTLKDPEKYFEAENKARSTILQGIGGALFFVTAYAALKQLRVAEDNRKLTEDKNVTDRFVKAAEMLADREKMMARLGGIHVLDRIARDSPEDHWTVMQLLISFVEDQAKEGSSKASFLGKDIAAALTAIGQRNVENDPELVLETEPQGLTKLLIRFAHLRFSTLLFLNFDRATFVGVNLSNSQLFRSNFKGTRFWTCPLSESYFKGGALSGAIFDECNLSRSNFIKTEVDGVRFLKCDLKASVFTDTDLSKTVFDGSDLSGTDFRVTEGLTEPKQVIEARNWKQAIYSPEFVSKLPLTDEEREEMTLISQNTPLTIYLKQED